MKLGSLIYTGQRLGNHGMDVYTPIMTHFYRLINGSEMLNA